jgi:transposase
MARPRLALQPHLTTEELRRRYRRCRDAREGRRWHALWLVSRGLSPAQAAATVGFDPSRVRQVIRRYNAEGPASVADGHRRTPGGPRPRLTPVRQARLRQALRGAPPGGGLWTGAKVAAWIDEQTRPATPTWPQLGWVYLRRLDQTRQVPRPRHRRAASPDEQAAWGNG